MDVQFSINHWSPNLYNATKETSHLFSVTMSSPKSATQIILHLILHPIAFPNSVCLRMTASDISDQLSK